MFNYTTDPTVMTMETGKEQYFRDKCATLLKHYTDYILIAYAKDPVMFSCIFTNSLISEKEVHYALIKKYYLTDQQENEYSNMIRKYIQAKQFAELEHLIEGDPTVKALLMENYLDNINKSNHLAYTNKRVSLDYDEMKEVLSAMNNFYIGREYKEAKQITLAYN